VVSKEDPVTEEPKKEESKIEKLEKVKSATEESVE